MNKNEPLYDKNGKQFVVGQRVRFASEGEMYPATGTGVVSEVTPEFYSSFVIQLDKPMQKMGPGGFLHKTTSLWWQCTYDSEKKQYFSLVPFRDTGDCWYNARFVEILEEGE